MPQTYNQAHTTTSSKKQGHCMELLLPQKEHLKIQYPNNNKNNNKKKKKKKKIIIIRRRRRRRRKRRRK